MFKKMSLVLAATVILVTSFNVCLAATATPADKQKAAVAAAQAWLKLVDDGNYGASWDQAATYFKAAVPRQQWETQISAVRRPMGKKLARTLDNARYMTSLPGAPDGEYVVITFNASFENKKTAVETITPMLEKDGKWRVSGYYIK
jgi:hypothetical protein